jgi:predicted MPP superfamily phosphohydrolase
MNTISRRLFLQSAGGLFVTATTGLGAYAGVIEPGFRLDVTSYNLTPPGWPPGLRLKAAVIADIHACEPFMSAARVRAIAELANAGKPDIILLLGDFNGGHIYVTGPVMPEQWGEALAVLSAPLGSYAVLGNHDWWHGALPDMPGDGGDAVRKALRAAGINVLENDAVRLTAGQSAFWLAGLGDQMAHAVSHHLFNGIDDLSGTLKLINDDAPIILLAHEPHIFHRVPERVSLTLCGHTHGGQVNVPILTARYAGKRFGNHFYGHIVENDRHMIISAGLGTSNLPVRFLRPPELVFVTLGGPAAPNDARDSTPA